MACGEVLEIAEGVLAEQFVLVHHQDRLLDLLDGGGEVVVPEQRHFFAQWGVGVEHSAEPPALAFECLLPVFLLHHLFALAADFFRFLGRAAAKRLLQGAALRDAAPKVGACLLLVGPGRAGESVRGFGRREQGIDRLMAAERVEGRDFVGATTETGAVEEVRRFEKGPGVVSLREHSGETAAGAGSCVLWTDVRCGRWSPP